MLPTPILYLSAFFEATRDEYYRQLYNVSAQGTWHEWLTYFLNGVAVQSNDVLSRAERIDQLIQDWLGKTERESPQTVRTVITTLAINPFVTVKHIATQLNI